MRRAGFAGLVLAGIVLCVCSLKAQDVSSGADWRRALGALPDRPGDNLSIQDVERFSQNIELAAPYFATLTPGDYEANRDLIRRIWAYMSVLDVMAGRNPLMRMQAGRARRTLGALPIWFAAYAGGIGSPSGAPAAPPPPPPPAAGPPFSLQCPDPGKIPASEQSKADELCTRYETSAARAASAWENAEILRQNLAREGMALNTQTGASVARLQLYFDLAGGDLRAHDWAEAAVNLERAEYETEKVFKTVGR